MIAEGIRALETLAVNAAKPQEIKTADTSKAHFAVGGSIKIIDLPLPPRDHKVNSLTDLIALVEKYHTPDYHSVVWYDEGSVVVVFDADERRESKATLTLVTSDSFKALLDATRTNKTFDPKAFVRFLRIELAGCHHSGELLDKVRRIKFDNGVMTSASNDRGKETFGKEVTSQVVGDVLPPETITLSVPVYKTLGERDRYPVRCNVDIDPAAGVFRLIPFPDELESVGHLALASIAERLDSGLTDGVKAYYGKP